LSLSLLRTGACHGKPVRGAVVMASYIILNLGLLLLLVRALNGVQVTYTPMFPLPAVGVFKGLWRLLKIRNVS